MAASTAGRIVGRAGLRSRAGFCRLSRLRRLPRSRRPGAARVPAAAMNRSAKRPRRRKRRLANCIRTRPAPRRFRLRKYRPDRCRDFVKPIWKRPSKLPQKNDLKQDLQHDLNDESKQDVKDILTETPTELNARRRAEERRAIPADRRDRSRRALTPVENSAFNELARQLSARLESENGTDAAAPPAPSKPSSSRRPDHAARSRRRTTRAGFRRPSRPRAAKPGATGRCSICCRWAC